MRWRFGLASAGHGCLQMCSLRDTRRSGDSGHGTWGAYLGGTWGQGWWTWLVVIDTTYLSKVVMIVGVGMRQFWLWNGLVVLSMPPCVSIVCWSRMFLFPLFVVEIFMTYLSIQVQGIAIFSFDSVAADCWKKFENGKRKTIQKDGICKRSMSETNLASQ